MPQQLNVSCDFNRFLVCKIPKDIVEVELKIKTKWGKYTLLKDFYTRTEKYRPWNRVNCWVRIHSRRRAPHQEKIDGKCHNSAGNTTSTDLGTYIPNGKGIWYHPKVITDSKYVTTVTQTDTENNSETDPPQIPFLGDYCETCISKWSRCVCKPGSDWDADPIDITQPDSSSNNDKGDRHPLPLNWSDQEHFLNGTDYEKTRPNKLRPIQMPP